MDITFKVKRVIVMTNLPGTDKVSLTLDGPSPFPTMGYEGHADIEVRAGYGVEWCRTALGVEPDEIIDCKTGVVTGRHAKT